MQKVMIILVVLAFVLVGYSMNAQADGCYICSGGSYVKYSGGDNADKRKAAKACGCKITGTRGSCDAGNLKILCSVQGQNEEILKLACPGMDKDLSDSTQTDKAEKKS